MKQNQANPAMQASGTRVRRNAYRNLAIEKLDAHRADEQFILYNSHTRVYEFKKNNCSSALLLYWCRILSGVKEEKYKTGIRCRANKRKEKHRKETGRRCP